MINQTVERLCGVGLLMLSPTHLIDTFLDRIEKLSGALVPAQVDKLMCEQLRIEADLDHFGATSTGDHTRYTQGF